MERALHQQVLIRPCKFGRLDNSILICHKEVLPVTLGPGSHDTWLRGQEGCQG
jgi:hypothetical protein